MDTATGNDIRERSPLTKDSGQIVLVFQGGGALGAFQAGVFQALHESGIEPDWIVGTSIGAINASLIAGNAPENRVRRLREFWNRVTRRPNPWDWPAQFDPFQSLSYWQTLCSGVSGFFAPQHRAFLGPDVQLGPDRAGFYSTAPLEATLADLVDIGLLNAGKPRLTVGAAHVRTSQMRYFDSRTSPLGIKHILASGALPPAFPAVRIDGELYWDGGILSNTPTEVVFDDFPRRSSLVFAVHLWNPDGPEPETISQVVHRQKDIQYSSRISVHIDRQRELHRLRHVIKDLAAHVPGDLRGSDGVRALEEHGCTTLMHIVRLIAPRLDREDQTKDIDFSASGIRQRWDAGYTCAQQAIAKAAWTGAYDHREGVILHEVQGP